MNFDALSYRAYYAARDTVGTYLPRRLPRVMKFLQPIKDLLLRQTPVWVTVRAGLSQGLWMKLDLRKEARLWRGEHERVVQRAILAAVGPGATVYDIGAHAGSIALGTARLVAPSGCVVAFEADPTNVENLRENTSRNKLNPLITIVSCAVWSCTTAQIPFRLGGNERSQGGVQADGQQPVLGRGSLIQVPTITIDDFIASGGRIPNLVKIDVEGGESEVLRGGASLFLKARPLLIVEIHHQEAAEQIREWLIRTRYSAGWMIPNEQFPRCLFAWPEEFDGAAWVSIIQVSTGRSVITGEPPAR